MKMLKDFSKFGWLCLIGLVLIGCRQNKPSTNPDELQGDLIVFHAGSLAVPMKVLADSFSVIHPGVVVKAESAGSLTCIRKITDLNRDCDILASADYSLIDKLMIPEFSSWNIRFAGNEMVIAYREESRLAEKMDSANWYSILLSPEVRFGRSDPNSDPCGYRTLLTLKLAEKFYGITDITAQFLNKDERFIRPKEVDLLALLESGTIDYIFIYKSVAIQHHLKYLKLPGEINLGQAPLTGLYNKVSVDVTGNKPGETITMQGEPMVYGLTIPKNSPNPKVADAFVEFILSDGAAIFTQLGQTPIQPALGSHIEYIPVNIRPLVKDSKD